MRTPSTQNYVAERIYPELNKKETLAYKRIGHGYKHGV